MRRSTKLVAIAAVLAAGAFGAAPLATASSDSTMVMHFHDTTVQQATIDLGAPGFSLGDQFVSSENVYRGSHKVGTANVACTVVRFAGANSLVQCVVTAILPDGQITIQGTNRDTPTTSYAITGGTGPYRDAGGWVKVVNTSATESNVTVYVDDLAG